MADTSEAYSQFDDLFFTRGDDDDAKEDDLIDFDDVAIEMEKNSEIQVVQVEEDPVAVEEERLSQRLSQMEAATSATMTITSKRPAEESPPSTTATTAAVKKAKTDTDLPSYLSTKNRLFDQTFRPLLQQTATSMTLDELREIARIVHHLGIARQWISVWQTYLLSGTGQLHKQPSGKDNPAVWPVDVKTTMIKQRATTARTEAEIDDAACLNYVQHYLRRLHNEADRLQAQLSHQKRELLVFTKEMEMAIEKFVRLQYMIQVDMKLQAKVIVVECEYEDRLIELDYLRLRPNEHQLKTFHLLSRSKREQEGSKYNVEILKRRVYHQQLPSLLDSVQSPTEAIVSAAGDQSTTFPLRMRCDRIIQQAKSQLMLVHVTASELKARRCDEEFHWRVHEMEKTRADPVSKERLTDAMVEVLQRRFKHIENRIQRLYQLKVAFFDEAPAVTSKYILIIDTDQPLSNEQALLLGRGPTYVPSCHMHVAPSPLSSEEEIWSRQWSLLRQQLTLFFSKYNVSINRKTTFQVAAKTLFQQSFSTPLPTSIQMRAVYEKDVVQSIRRQLKHERLILRRTADGNNVFYLGRTSDFEAKANDYLTKSKVYAEIHAYDEQSIDADLRDLRQNRRINEQHFKRMQVKRTDLRLPRLDFLPETQPGGSITLQPMMVSFSRSPIQPVAQYLQELLRPLYDTHTQSTTIANGADLIERLIRHCDYILLPHTRFVTIKLHSFYAQMSHGGIADALGRFLTSVLTVGRHQNLAIDTIQQLVALFLRNNVCTYRDRIYRHVTGSPRCFPLTRTLGDIYLWDWQNSLISQLTHHEEFYGRYYDTALITWSLPNIRLYPILEELNQKYPDLQMANSVGYSVDFLGVFIENRQGTLYTRVHHDPTVTPFLLPYVIGHPRLFYRQWFQWALRRAVRFSMSMNDFDDERRYIELTLLANGYSLEFVNAGLSTFFAQYFAVSLQTYPEKPVYERLRHRLLTSVNLERQYRKQQQQWRLNNQWIHLHYLYDWGPRCQFNRKFKQLWSDLIRKDPIFVDTDLKLKLSSVHCHTLNALLTQEAI